MYSPKSLPLPPSPYTLIYQIMPLGNFTAPQIFEALKTFSHPFLLESVKGSLQTARYSFIGSDPFLVFKSRGYQIEITQGESIQRISNHPLQELKRLMNRYRLPQPPGFPPFIGGAAGYFSYDVCRFFEHLPCTTDDDLNLPEIYLSFYDSAAIIDQHENSLWLLSTGLRLNSPDKAYQSAREWVEKTAAALTNPLPQYKPPIPTLSTSNQISSNFTQAGFEKIVANAQEYIRAGDIFQVNLSQRLQSPISGDYWELYKSLRRINPSPFACYLEDEDFTIVSCSPERLVRLQDRQVDTRPIAGTRPRGRDRQEDADLSAELILSEKERAEHIMLVDLERNDLGRICEYGSVRVNELMVIEDYSHVFHIVSNVQGRLLAGKDCFHVLRATFPGGTITGTPKIRSMEIIDELEPTRRGIYTGSIGYLSFGGNLDLNIVIRTFLIKNNTAYIQVGCGIVADSIPEKEYWETLHKAEALLQTLQVHSMANCASI
ncbi:MAG: aminodeoxychorismate synthase component I [Candidatus Schekmanbacteria bacterium]|nr:aminodeoxychorismate synthase component I [Candidatus Schekmanbacteria bacterium]